MERESIAAQVDALFESSDAMLHALFLRMIDHEPEPEEAPVGHAEAA